MTLRARTILLESPPISESREADGPIRARVLTFPVKAPPFLRPPGLVRENAMKNRGIAPAAPFAAAAALIAA